jgi:hypothetical protein
MRRPVELHPPELSLLRSKIWAREILERSGFRLSSYSFGPADFFVQAIVVAEKRAANH